MNWLVYHIVSGHSFFSGIGLLIVAVLASTKSQPIFGRITLLAFVIGVLAVIVSSTAIPYWLYLAAIVSTLMWVASWYMKPWRSWAPYTTVAVWFLAAMLEVPYHITPTLVRAGTRSMTIIGDSVTAGIGGGDTAETWPSILAREHKMQVQNISHMGDTTRSALKRVKSQQITGSVVVVEMGGNDILGSTTSQQFERELDELITNLLEPNRQIVMFELPLPPFGHEFGRAQRDVAAKHGVILLPKRFFLSVIAGSNSTLDTIHLSQSGHQEMADCVWQLVRSAFDPE